MTADISRLFRDPEKRFHALVRQQGRLTLDAEENHGADIGQWSDETRFVETIAPSGSPDDGFRISLLAGAPTDFRIAAGSYYLGGARVESSSALDYRDQRALNWLGFPLDAEGAAETIGPAVRKFLVWLDAWEATVTATEDSELLEPGLGGPDGAARKRFAWRVRATPVAGPGCLVGAAQWLTAMGWTGKVDPDTGQLSSGATLTVGFNPADVDQDLCAPSLTPGFLGARNECYRVMVTRPGRYVWSQDDASPLYRVRVENDGAGNPRRIVFLDTPRDEFLRPRAGHTVELLRWDQLLPSRQKTAEPMGAFFRVSSGYVDDAIAVSTDVDAAWTAWLAGLPAGLLSNHDDPNEQRYFYLRVWTGGGAGNQPDIPFATVDLPGTGLTLAFSGAPAPMPGDAWTIAARPNAPTEVMPWALLDGMEPHAPRRHVVPLAYVDLDLNGGTVIDCRRRFRPLYRVGGCCTVTVGDGVSSWGDVSTIAEALNRLPPSGGEICVGPGTYAENVVITDRANISISGCGTRTRWTAANPALPLLTIRGCDDITVKRLRMEGGASQCVLAEQAPGAPAGQRNRGLSLEELVLAAPSGSAVSATFLERMQMRLCNVAAGPFPVGPPPAATAGLAAVFLQGDDLLVQRNRIGAALPDGALPSQRPLGGLHIGGDSRRVIVLRNRIEQGNGNGITLGSVRMVGMPAAAFAADAPAAAGRAYESGRPVGFNFYIDERGCIRIGWTDPTPGDRPDGTVEVPVSDGTVSDIRIERNRIADMGGSGIATFPMFVVLATGDAAMDAVAVENLLALDNVILGCMAMETPPVPDVQFLFTGFGGIALGMAADCTIRDNQIADIGAARQLGICGIFVGYGEDLRIERNRIENNGSAIAGGQSAAPAGGIFVRVAIGGISTEGAEAERSRTRDRPALWVQNNVVHAPFARALRAMAVGPVHVSDNRLTGSNPSLFFAQPLFALLVLIFGTKSFQEVLADPSSELDLDNLILLNLIVEILGGDAVNIVNLGLAEELMLPYAVRGFLKNDGVAAERWRGSHEMAASFAARGRPPAQMLRGGEIMFANNQVSLHRSAEENAATISSVFILTRDDIGFADNQLEIEADMLFALADAVLLAGTLRANSNRLQESAFCFLSMMSFATMLNTTADNQSTFRVGALAPDPSRLVERDNISFF